MTDEKPPTPADQYPGACLDCGQPATAHDVQVKQCLSCGGKRLGVKQPPTPADEMPLTWLEPGDGTTVWTMCHTVGPTGVAAAPRRARPSDLSACLAALPEDQRAEVIKHALDIGGLGGFECDPRDSAALLELREIIDDEFGWDSAEQEDEANYAGRLREVVKRWKHAEDALSGEQSFVTSLTAERDALQEKLNECNKERYAAINEMAKARGLAQDAQLRYDFLCYDQEVEAEERGGQFARLWKLLQESVKREDRSRRDATDAEMQRLVFEEKLNEYIEKVKDAEKRAELAEAKLAEA